MALSHSFNTIAGGNNTAGTGGVGGNEYPTTGEDINDRQSPQDTVEAVMFALGTDGDAASADTDVYVDFLYDTLFGGFVLKTTDNNSGASGTDSFTESEEFDYFTSGGTRTDMLGGSRVHYSNDSTVSGETYPGPVDELKLKLTTTNVQDTGSTTYTQTLDRRHFQGTGSPATIGTYTNDTWFSVHNVGGQSGLDVPTDGIGIRCRFKCETSTSGNQTARLQKRHVIECWARLSGKDDTKVFEYQLDMSSRSDSTF
jgi:hypothetical protein